MYPCVRHYGFAAVGLASKTTTRERRAIPKRVRDTGARVWRERGFAAHQPGVRLGVCIMTADFWGIKSAGGTATAYHLLAEVRLWAQEQRG